MKYTVSLHTGRPSDENEVKYTGYERVIWDSESGEPADFPQCPHRSIEKIRFFALWQGGKIVDVGEVTPNIQLDSSVMPRLMLHLFKRIDRPANDIAEKMAKHHGEWRRWDGENTIFTSLPELALVEIERLRSVIERDRTNVSEVLRSIRILLESKCNPRDPGRGAETWSDERYQTEIEHFYGNVQQHLNSLAALTYNWSDTPNTPEAIAKARATKVPLLEQAADALKTLIGHDAYANLKHKYGEKWWVPINILEQNLRTASRDLARNGGVEIPNRYPAEGDVATLITSIGPRLCKWSEGEWIEMLSGEIYVPLQPCEIYAALPISDVGAPA